MAAGQDTALQINYKLSDGTLVNLYAKDQAHLESLLTSISDLSTLITATSAALGVNATPAANVAYAKQALGAEQIAADKVCKHGHMLFKEGQGAKGPWKGWFCPAPKGTPDQCQPVFVR